MPNVSNRIFLVIIIVFHVRILPSRAESENQLVSFNSDQNQSIVNRTYSEHPSNHRPIIFRPYDNTSELYKIENQRRVLFDTRQSANIFKVSSYMAHDRVSVRDANLIMLKEMGKIFFSALITLSEYFQYSVQVTRDYYCYFLEAPIEVRQEAARRVQEVAQKKEDMKSRQTQRRNESISKVINSVKEVGITIYRDLLRPTLLTALGERKLDLVKLLLRPKEEIRKEPTPEVQRSIFSIARLLPFPFSIFFKDSRN
jgi:hypothetical protein